MDRPPIEKSIQNYEKWITNHGPATARMQEALDFARYAIYLEDKLRKLKGHSSSSKEYPGNE